MPVIQPGIERYSRHFFFSVCLANAPLCIRWKRISFAWCRQIERLRAAPVGSLPHGRGRSSPFQKKKHKKSWNIQCAVSPYFPRKKMERKTKLRAGLSPYFIFLSLSETFHEIIALCPVSRFPAAGLLRHGRGAVRHHWQSSTNLVRKPRGNWVVDSPSSSSFYFDFIQHNEMLVVFSLYTFFPMFVDLRRVTLSAA